MAIQNRFFYSNKNTLFDNHNKLIKPKYMLIKVFNWTKMIKIKLKLKRNYILNHTVCNSNVFYVIRKTNSQQIVNVRKVYCYWTTDPGSTPAQVK